MVVSGILISYGDQRLGKRGKEEKKDLYCILGGTETRKWVGFGGIFQW